MAGFFRSGHISFIHVYVFLISAISLVWFDDTCTASLEGFSAISLVWFDGTCTVSLEGWGSILFPKRGYTLAIVCMHVHIHLTWHMHMHHGIVSLGSSTVVYMT